MHNRRGHVLPVCSAKILFRDPAGYKWYHLHSPPGYADGKARIYKMPAEINKGLCFALVKIIGGDECFIAGINTEIDPVASALWQFFDPVRQAGYRSIQTIFL
jgi:hypothetical protein